MKAYLDWHIPYQQNEISLSQAVHELELTRGAVTRKTLFSYLKNHPTYGQQGHQLFSPKLDEQLYDCIHIILGRGFMMVDEAFCIGFILGSTKKVVSTETSLKAYIARHFCNDFFDLMSDAEVQVLREAVRLAYISNCQPLDSFNYSEWSNENLKTIRNAIGLEDELMMAYYEIEKRRNPKSKASRRLVAA